MEPGFDEVLTPDALEFLAELQQRFGERRRELLKARARRRAQLAAGELLDFLPETREIRDGDWTVARSQRTCSSDGLRSRAQPTAS
jgi:malate synthase